VDEGWVVGVKEVGWAAAVVGVKEVGWAVAAAAAAGGRSTR